MDIRQRLLETTRLLEPACNASAHERTWRLVLAQAMLVEIAEALRAEMVSRRRQPTLPRAAALDTSGEGDRAIEQAPAPPPGPTPTADGQDASLYGQQVPNPGESQHAGLVARHRLLIRRSRRQRR